jgi:predicted Zn-dependent protease
MSLRMLTRCPTPTCPRRRASLLPGAWLGAWTLTLLALLARAPALAQSSARATCQNNPPAAAVKEAQAALGRNPDELGPLLRLADALVDQGCYQDAVAVLEDGQAAHPHSTQLTGKLRNVRSMVAEERYIQNVTEAADAAKLQHDRLRCERLSDVEACNQALRSAPDDLPLLVAKADALVQGGHPDEAVGIYEHAARLSPANVSLQAKLASAQAALASTNVAPPEGTAPVASAVSPEKPSPSQAAPVVLARARAAPARAAAPTPVSPILAQARTYSNDAPPGRSN